LTALIGRGRDLEVLGQMLARTRLVTVTGPGGVGKTRVALEVARQQLARRADGVWLVDLAVPELRDVAAETARVLEVRSPRGKPPTEALRRYLVNRDLLLVLDNCEQVVAGCAQLVTALLTSCRDVRVLATSRESLGVPGETVWRLDPLTAQDAYRLFVERARQREPRFMPSEATDTAIGELCSRLDRLPLAIELAAARVNVMSPAELLAGLETRLGELGGTDRLAPPHHRTVRATVEWSYQLLDPAEQRAFRSLAVFVGGFDAEAPRAVAPGLSSELFARLVDKSLVAVAENPAGRTRYRLLETMRQYADELLVTAGELDAARERHLRHFTERAGSFEPRWPSARSPLLVEQLADDYENFRAALEWAAAADPCAARPLLTAVKDLLLLLGVADGHRLAHLLLERCPAQDRERVEVQIVFGSLAMLAADVEAARRALAEAEQLSVVLGEPELEGWAHLFHGLTDTLAGSITTARQHLEATRALHDQLSVRSGWARATAVLGLTFLMAGEPARARELVEQALAIDVEEDDEWGQGHCHLYLGIIEESVTTHPEVVTSHYRQAIDRLRSFRGGPLLPAALIGQAGVLVPRHPDAALRVVAAAYALRDRGGAEFAPFFQARAERIRAAAEVPLGPDAPQTWRDGSRLGVDDAIALAFGTKRPRPASPNGLSVREREVARLVAEGLANKEIAARLHLSVRTVESHVRHALTKTGLINRTQLATWARERTQ
jgi:non-specific serine/threonine protein kinase